MGYLERFLRAQWQEYQKRQRPQLEICGQRKATNFLVTQALRNLDHRTQARRLKKGQVCLSQHVAVNDTELVERPGVEAANLLPARKTEVDENQRLRVGLSPLFNESFRSAWDTVSLQFIVFISSSKLSDFTLAYLFLAFR